MEKDSSNQLPPSLESKIKELLLRPSIKNGSEALGVYLLTNPSRR